VALLATRAQTTVAELTGERRIRPVEPESGDLIEQYRGPQMRSLNQSLPAIVNERCEHVVTRRRPHTGTAFTVQIGTDRLAVMTQMAGDRSDRPASLTERVRVYIILLCEHGIGLPLVLACC